MVVSGKTRIYGVIGDPIDHTLSPVMHNAAFEALKLDCAFLAFKVKPPEVGNAINGMRAFNIQGLNVTMPHKEAVIKHLDEIDSTARLLNAVNTIQNKNGKLLGFNTDGEGALKALRANQVDPKNKKVLLLGAGGAARAIAYSLSQEVGELVILNRTPKPVEELTSFLKQASNKKITGGVLSPEILENNLADANVLINATSIGMKPNTDQSPIKAKWLRRDLAVMDIVYNPVETKLLKNAKTAKSTVISGVEMLIYQGAASFEIWTSCKAPVEVMRKAALNHLKKV
jgi:shikimate dehydrogenase